MKKFFVLVLSVVAAFAAILSLTACDNKPSGNGGTTITDGDKSDDNNGGQDDKGNEAPEHSHIYNKQVAEEKYLKSAATCTAKAVYYYSCECGEKGTQTFEYGDKLPHTYNKQVATQKYLKSAATCAAKAIYYFSCECGEKGTQTFEYGNKLPHTFDKQITEEKYLKSVATCTAKATYYFSCECGEKGEQTFEYGELVKHNFGKDHFCVNCGYYTDDLIGTEISSLSLNIKGDVIKGKVANAQTTFSFVEDIEVADGASYVVCMDFDCSQVALRKIIALSSGDNVCYILVTNGDDMQLYTVTVRRRPIYTVAFDTNGGTSIDSQQVEEDNYAECPDSPKKAGYEFIGFNFDFTNRIISNTTIVAKWMAKTDTP